MGISEDDIVIGHVGKFEYQKNYQFLLKVFSKLHNLDKRYKLVLVGDGSLKSEVENVGIIEFNGGIIVERMVS
jgi:glycosyltransferase involved in cell wall biosynthesis